MLNFIWPLFIIISFIYAILKGNISEINQAVFDSITQAVELSITLLGTMCFWNGIMNIAKNTNLINRITKILKPIIKYLFPDMKNNKEVQEEISMNMVSNILGLGNAATPLGLKAMNSMQKENKNKDVISNSMAMLIVINTASLQIIPTTLIAIRTSLKSLQPAKIIVPVWITTILAMITVVSMSKILSKKY